MNTSTTETGNARARDVTVTEESLTVDLVDGRTLSAPLAWYPRVSHATSQERNNWQLIGDGEGIHWPDLDEDVSVLNLLDGQRAGESQRSFASWIEQRARGGT